MNKNIRLSKLMSEQGLASRREADRLIEKGYVLVNGQVVDVLGSKVAQDAKITLKKEGEQSQNQKLSIMLHKPLGYVSCQPEKGYREAIELICEENRDKHDKSHFRLPFKLKGFAAIGRLDINSKGLLILSQDGRLAKKVISEQSLVEKEYLVRIEGFVTPEKILRLQHGLQLDDQLLKPAKVDLLDDQLLRFILIEGRKRQIRRMCEQVQLKVISLKRVRIGPIKLGPLKSGTWRFIHPSEWANI